MRYYRITLEKLPDEFWKEENYDNKKMVLNVVDSDEISKSGLSEEEMLVHTFRKMIETVKHIELRDGGI
jgi:hypothetical protein